jgi:SAM-dependent methyltransferase
MKDTILWRRESDAYTDRARALHADKLYSGKHDAANARTIASILPVEKRAIRRILDIGCGYGALTAALARTFPKATVVGIDPGARSIAAARRALRPMKNVELLVGHSHEIKLREPFDLVVLRMVLQWVPRTLLLKTIAEIDRLCGSFLFISDYLPRRPTTSISVHNKEIRIFKQDYAAIFESLPYYKRVHARILDAEHGDGYRRTEVLLRKLPLDESYTARKAVQHKDKGRGSHASARER